MALEKRGKTWHYDLKIRGVRYRGSLKTTDWRQAQSLESELRQRAEKGELAGDKQTKALARLKFRDAAERWIADRAPDLAANTVKCERERSRAINRVLGSRSVSSLVPEDLLAYRRERKADGISNGTLNRELDIFRGVLKKARRWTSRFAEEVKPLKKVGENVGRALTDDQKVRLLKIATLRPAWQAAYYGGILALNTTCRGCELKGLQWRDIDLINHAITIRRSKTDAGLRVIPLNADAIGAMTSLYRRALELGPVHPDHYIFFACERGAIDPTHPMKSWRTAWRTLTRAIRCPRCRLVQDPAPKCKAKGCDEDLSKITSPLAGLRFHDLRHHAITELAESQTSDTTIMSIAGHVSRKMLDHYSHIRMAAKRTALDQLSMAHGQGGYATNRATTGVPEGSENSQVLENMVELVGLEPTTSSLRTMRSPESHPF
ncbi:MAG: site-specific integrase [Candidatus Korobacteraceae bacterium]